MKQPLKILHLSSFHFVKSKLTEENLKRTLWFGTEGLPHKKSWPLEIMHAAGRRSDKILGFKK